jgi:hypothetical protein
MTDERQSDRPDENHVPDPEQEAAEAKVPLEENPWLRSGADAPDGADIEDPETQL